MKRLLVGALVTVVASMAGFAAGTLTSSPVVSADEGEDHTAEEATQEETSTVYKYVAQPGDSYALMARKATQTYGHKFEKNLSEAAILYVETNLTKHAGSPLLEVGQQVEVDENLVGQWVEKAEKLNDQQLAAWNYYAQFADFNTDDVGEAR